MNLRILLRRVILLLLLADSPATAQPQPCSDLLASGAQLAYRFRANDARCEGLFIPRSATPGVEIASLTLGPVHWRPTQDAVLLIDVPGSAESLQLRGMALPPEGPYRLLAVLPTGRTFRLPLQDVIQPARILPQDLGLVAIRRERIVGAEVFVPVRVSTVASAAPVPNRSPLLVLRPRGDIVDLRWRLILPSAAQVPSWQSIGRTTPLILSGERIEIELAPLARDGITELRLQYEDRSGRAWAQNYLLARQ
jgi:hypothetical protein